jgi:23S rRNA pseudouridine1911/1915/1917 synthase
MTEQKVFWTEGGDSEERLDRYLNRVLPGLSRSRLQNLIREGKVLVNGRPAAKSGVKLKPGQEIRLELPPPEKAEAAPEAIPLDVVHEDEDLIVINKPQGMVVHPSRGHQGGTLVNALLHHCRNLSGIGGVLRPGILHRLDKDTSGLLLAAKNDRAHLALSEQLKNRLIRREYLALVYGHPVARGTVDAPLGRHPRERQKMAVAPGAREAVTHFQVLEEFAGVSLVLLRLETGRTHQIRVHLAYIGHPVLGDPVYGRRRERFRLPGQALHACRLGFTHPRTGRYLEFAADPPRAFRETLAALRGETGGGGL